MGKHVIIDGVTINVPYIKLKRTADVLDKYAKRTEDGDLHREIAGVYFNYQITFGSFTNMQQYEALWKILTQPEEFHTITVPDSIGNYTYKAYISSVADEFAHVGDSDADRIITGLTAKFTAKAPVPSSYWGG